MHNPDWTIENSCKQIGSRHFERKAVSQWFPYPHSGIWPAHEASFVDVASQLGNALPATMRPFFFQSLVASFLLAPDRAPAQFPVWISSHADWNELLGTELSLEQLQSWLWITVPVALAGDTDYCIPTVRMLLVGSSFEKNNCQLLPTWADTLLDVAAQVAILNAGRVAVKRYPDYRFFFCPLLDRSSKACIIHGPSVGLPAYLGAFTLASHVPIPDILTTGEVAADACLVEVGHLAEKLKVAGEKQFSAFMYPALVAVDPLVNSDSPGVIKLPIRTLREAEIVWTRHSTGYAQEIAHFERIFADPPRLLEALPDQDGILLSLIEEEQERICELLAPLLSRGDNETFVSLAVFTQKMESLLNRPDWDRVKVPICLSLFELPSLEAILLQNPVLAFRLSLLQLKLANHSGETANLQKWEELTKQAYRRIGTHDADDKKLEFMVNLFVGKIQNSYSFAPDIPKEFRQEFDDLVPWLERLYAKNKERQGKDCVHYALGCYYGTMMQHYAFCGSEYINKTLEFSVKAQEAFGNGAVADYRDDYLRQFCYLTYAYLDTNRFDEAKESILKYLELTRLENFDFASETNPFKHSLLVRYLADTERQFPEYLAWATNNPYLTNRHPWQLWLFNMGRIETDENQRDIIGRDQLKCVQCTRKLYVVWKCWERQLWKRLYHLKTW